MVSPAARAGYKKLPDSADKDTKNSILKVFVPVPAVVRHGELLLRRWSIFGIRWCHCTGVRLVAIKDNSRFQISNFKVQIPDT